MFVFEDEIIVAEEPYELTVEDVAYLNEWDYYNGEDDDPDGSLAEAELKELNDIWYASRGVR